MATKNPAELEFPVSPEWDRDPYVIASRRARNIAFPAILLLRDPTEEERAKWKDATGMERGDATMRIEAGVTFLGALTTQWMLQSADSHAKAPKSAPPADVCSLIWPAGTSDNTIKNAAAFRCTGAPESIDPAKVSAAWRRVLEYLRAEEARVIERDGNPSGALFTAVSGFDAPEMVVCKLSEVLGQKSSAGQAGHQHLSNAIAWAKNGRHLGALHDYAVRTPGAWSIVESCRARAIRAPSLVSR
jgi:hypothetical protein